MTTGSPRRLVEREHTRDSETEDDSCGEDASWDRIDRVYENRRIAERIGGFRQSMQPAAGPGKKLHRPPAMSRELSEVPEEDPTATTGSIQSYQACMRQKLQRLGCPADANNSFEEANSPSKAVRDGIARYYDNYTTMECEEEPMSARQVAKVNEHAVMLRSGNDIASWPTQQLRRIRST